MSGQQPSGSQKPIEFDFVTTKRGKRLLLRGGYSYHKKRDNQDGGSTWYCVQKAICKAVLVLTCTNLIKRESKHDCQPDFTANDYTKRFDNCRQRVVADIKTPIPRIFRETVADIKNSTFDLIMKIPKFNNVKGKFYRQRRKALNVTKLCFKKVKSIIIPERFQSFVLADYQSTNRIIIFCNEAVKTLLATNTYDIFCDGTFKFCLHPFYQLYSLHINLGSDTTYNNIVPVIFALLPNKLKKTYEMMFRLIKSQIPEWKPKSFTLDYEMAAIQAIESVFPEVPVSGCYFHFSRCLWRKADEFGIIKSKLNRKHIKRCIALSHLPSEVIDDAWLYVMSKCSNYGNVTKFNDYFVDTWLVESSFFFNRWSCYKQQNRTTNMVESWHATVNKVVQKKPRNVAQFLTLLQEEANYFEILTMRVQKDETFHIHTKTSETIEIDEHISTTILDYENQTISLEHCIELLVL